MLRKRQLKIGKVYKTKFTTYLNGIVTVTDINDDFVEFVGDTYTTRRVISVADVKYFRSMAIREITKHELLELRKVR